MAVLGIVNSPIMHADLYAPLTSQVGLFACNFLVFYNGMLFYNVMLLYRLKCAEEKLMYEKPFFANLVFILHRGYAFQMHFVCVLVSGDKLNAIPSIYGFHVDTVPLKKFSTVLSA